MMTTPVLIHVVIKSLLTKRKLPWATFCCAAFNYFFKKPRKPCGVMLLLKTKKYIKAVSVFENRLTDRYYPYKLANLVIYFLSRNGHLVKIQ